jgi:cytidyltransferase-like protein
MSARRVIYSAGVFDLFHEGHLHVLQESRRLGDMLVVGVVTDQGASAYKPAPPTTKEGARLKLVAALSVVDAAFLQPGTDPSSVIVALDAIGLRPVMMTHGSDWSQLREGSETLERLGIEFRTIPLLEDKGLRLSTTGIVGRIRAMGGAK